MQDFRQLRVWKRAHEAVLNVRRATRAFSRIGHGSLKSQMVRSADSIPFNIVEGCAAASRKEFARFLDISIKSSSELEYQLQLARDLEALPGSCWRTLSAEVVEIRRMLCGLRRRILAADQAMGQRRRRD